MPNKSKVKLYQYRREDNGEIIEVDFITHMNSSGGYITAPDGVACRVVPTGNLRQRASVPKDGRVIQYNDSDALGCIEASVGDMRDDVQRHGLTGVEFVPDPDVAGFYKARFSSAEAKARYAKHRNIPDRSGSQMGFTLPPGHLEQMAKRV